MCFVLWGDEGSVVGPVQGRGSVFVLGEDGCFVLRGRG